MSDAKVRYEQHDDVAVITMDDGKANALSLSLLAELGSALDRAEADAKAVLLAGRPGRFSAGFDLKVMMSGAAAVRELVGAGGEFLLRLYAHPQPVVAAVTGHALAGGVLLAASCDTRIGVRGAFKLGLNEVQNGMAVPILAHELARERLSPKAFTESVLQARIYDPDSALVAGWLDAVVEPDALADAAMTAAGRLAKLPRRAYAVTKQCMRGRAIAYMRETLQQNLIDLTGG